MATSEIARPQVLIEIFGEDKLLEKEGQIFEAIRQKVENKKAEYYFLGDKARHHLIRGLTFMEIARYYAATIESVEEVKRRHNFQNSDLIDKLELVPIKVI